MSLAIATSRLSKVMEQSSNGYAVGREPARMGKHVFIDFQ